MRRAILSGVLVAGSFLLSSANLPCRAEPAGQSAEFVTCTYRPALIYAAGAAETSGHDPIAQAKTPEQRRFLVEYYRVLRGDSGILHKNPSYLFMEPLRRCGIKFPEGTRVVWVPFDPPLMVIHTPATIKQIEKYMGLTPCQPRRARQPNPPT